MVKQRELVALTLLEIYTLTEVARVIAAYTEVTGLGCLDGDAGA